MNLEVDDDKKYHTISKPEKKLYDNMPIEIQDKYEKRPSCFSEKGEVLFHPFFFLIENVAKNPGTGVALNNDQLKLIGKVIIRGVKLHEKTDKIFSEKLAQLLPELAFIWILKMNADQAKKILLSPICKNRIDLKEVTIYEYRLINLKNAYGSEGKIVKLELEKIENNRKNLKETPSNNAQTISENLEEVKKNRKDFQESSSNNLQTITNLYNNIRNFFF
jgi:hypothetical protein